MEENILLIPGYEYSKQTKGGVGNGISCELSE